MESKQLQQKQDHDSTARSREFTVGGLVSVRNFGQGDKWLPGVVIKRTGPVSFCVAMDQGVVRRCHQDQLRSRSVASVSDPIVSETTEESPLPDITADVGDSESPGHNPPLSTPARAYPSRVRNPPDRFTPRLSECLTLTLYIFFWLLYVGVCSCDLILYYLCMGTLNFRGKECSVMFGLVCNV